MMKRLLITLLFLFPSFGFSNGSLMVGALEQAAGVQLGDISRQLILDHTPPGIERTERFLIHRAMEDFKTNLFSQGPKCDPILDLCPLVQTASVEARYCITRCTGTGADRVCYEICYED